MRSASFLEPCSTATAPSPSLRWTIVKPSSSGRLQPASHRRAARERAMSMDDAPPPRLGSPIPGRRNLGVRRSRGLSLHIGKARSFSCLSSIAEGRLGDSTRVLQKSSRPRLRGPIASCNSLTALPPMMAMRTRLMHESGPSGVPVTVIDPEELATDFSRTLSAALPRHSAELPVPGETASGSFAAPPRTSHSPTMGRGALPGRPPFPRPLRRVSHSPASSGRASADGTRYFGPDTSLMAPTAPD